MKSFFWFFLLSLTPSGNNKPSQGPLGALSILSRGHLSASTRTTWATKGDDAFCKHAALGSAKGRTSGLQPGLVAVVLARLFGVLTP